MKARVQVLWLDFKVVFSAEISFVFTEIVHFYTIIMADHMSKSQICILTTFLTNMSLHFWICRAVFMMQPYYVRLVIISNRWHQTSVLTSWDSKATLSPSLAIPSSFSSLRWGHRARQKARAIRSVSRSCSADSLAPLLGRSPLCRKNTCAHHTQTFKERKFQIDLCSYFKQIIMYFCPADDLSIFFVFWLLEHLNTADGLHGLPINGANDTGGHKHTLPVISNIL